MATYITVCVTVRVSEREAQSKETGLFSRKPRKKVANVNKKLSCKAMSKLHTSTFRTNINEALSYFCPFLYWLLPRKRCKTF